MHFKSIDTAIQYYNRVLRVLVDSEGSLILGWIIELLYVTTSCFDQSSIFVRAITIQQSALLHVSKNFPVRRRKSRAPDRPDYSKGTHMKALIQWEMLQELGWHRAANKLITKHHRNHPYAIQSSQESPCDWPGPHPQSGFPAVLGGPAASTVFPPFQKASSAHISQLTQASHRWAACWAAQGQHCIYDRLLSCQVEF